MYKVLNRLYRPDDRLGVEMFGVSDWNRLKGRVCGLTNAALCNSVDASCLPKSQTPLFEVLFRPDRNACNELLGSGVIDTIDNLTTSSGWWDTWMKAKDTGESIASLIPIAQPFVAAGRKVNNLTSNIWDMIRGKKSDETPTAVKAGIGIGGVLLLGGAAYGIYYLTKKKKRR